MTHSTRTVTARATRRSAALRTTGRRTGAALMATGALLGATACGSSGGSSNAMPSVTSTASYSLAQVKTHHTASSCWVAIDGGVYDLTKWINQHPGGPDKILGICGTDATSAFEHQHSEDPEPKQKLAGFQIGRLS